MKNIIKTNSYIIIPLTVFLMVGCVNFDELNTNPNTLTSDKVDVTIAGPAFGNALYKGTHNGSGVFGAVPDDHGTHGLIVYLHSMLFVHYQSAGTPSWQTERNGINDGWRERGWLRYYTLAVPALNIAYKGAEGNAEALAVLDIWKAYMYHKVTDEWGPVPYTKAGIGGTTVPYDSQESMYNDFFTLLKKANTTLLNATAPSVEIFAVYDRIFNADIGKWRRFGNTLRLRLALRISDVDAAKAKTEAEEAVAAGVMETNDQSAYFDVNEKTDNNFVKMAGYSGWGFSMTASMESILKGYNDPRMPVWFSPSKTGAKYTGQPNGAGTIRPWTKDDKAYTNDETFGSNLKATKKIEVMVAAETYFNRAEGVLKGWNMGGDTAKALYEQGITLSMQQWGITDTKVITDYIAGTSLPVVPNLGAEYTKAGLDSAPPVKVPVAWSSTPAEQRTQITVQKYLALFPEPMEAWSDLRRTDADILYPLLQTESTDANVGRGLMKRLTYLPSEYSTNNAEVQEAIKKLNGTDTGGSKVWWDVNEPTP